MTSVAELVLSDRVGILSRLAAFAPIEIGTLNRAGRASTEAAFRQIAENYVRSALIRPFMLQLTDISLSARDRVAATIQVIFPPGRLTLGANESKPIYRELKHTYLESVLSAREARSLEKLINWNEKMGQPGGMNRASILGMYQPFLGKRFRREE